MASNPTGTVIIVTGTPTVFVPLDLAWPSSTDCTSNIYLHTPVASPNTFIAWDPLYGAAMVTSAQSCLPEQVTIWWNQPASSLFTALGPAFYCPGAYSPILTVVVASSLHQTFCCPTGYSILVPQANTAAEFPSQCVSTVTNGQKFTYLASQGSPDQLTTTVAMTTSATVFAVPVNGFNLAVGPTLALTTLSTQTSTVTTPPASVSPTTSTPATKTTDVAKPSSLSPGAYAGIAISIVVVVAFLATGAFLLFRRRRQQKQAGEREKAAPIEMAAVVETPKILHSETEFNDSRGYNSEIYELPGR
ncbi:hypothetical protein SBRCBS47491_007857 [Sporothrix bragantina]|uniref:Uncharacterized protein n=1 Tax=Sporothrix bragantina TaxID=671064 RepID=A0ABP0CGP7_9PEZI